MKEWFYMENKNDMAIEINQLISTLAVDGDVVLKNQIRVTNKAKQVIEEEDEQVVNELKNQIANLSMVILNKKEHMKNLLARLNDMIDKM